MTSNLNGEPERRCSGPCFREPVRAAGPGAPVEAQDQSIPGAAAPQGASPDLIALEAACGRMIREHGVFKRQLDCLQAQSNVQLAALRDEQKRRLHAERMQAAVELRLDDLDEQNNELLKALELLYEALQTPQSDAAFETMLSFALSGAKALIDVHQPPAEGVAA